MVIAATTNQNLTLIQEFYWPSTAGPVVVVSEYSLASTFSAISTISITEEYLIAAINGKTYYQKRGGSVETLTAVEIYT
jgi:hypothetical protein